MKVAKIKAGHDLHAYKCSTLPQGSQASQMKRAYQGLMVRPWPRGLAHHRTAQVICGNANSGPRAMLSGQRCITALWRV